MRTVLSLSAVGLVLLYLSACTQAECLRESDCPLRATCTQGRCKMPTTGASPGMLNGGDTCGIGTHQVQQECLVAIEHDAQ